VSVANQMEIFKRGLVDFIGEDELVKKLKSGKKLNVKLGLDPTSPDLHLGHTVILQKLKQFQDAGHQVILIVGDFTAKVGDPSGRNETRPVLTDKEIKQNAKTYADQVFKILDKKKTKLVFNSSWLGKLDAVDMIRLASQYTVARMLERDDFKKRFAANKAISIHEFLYPLLQGRDSVEINADVELGGTDQLFNLLVGRELQGDAGQDRQSVLTMPLLIGTDGEKKMSKSYGNAIGISESPKEQFGKIMSSSDEMMWTYYELLSDKTLVEIKKMKAEVSDGSLHPKKVKENLGKEIVARFHGENDADKACEEFNAVFSAGMNPEEMQVLQANPKTPLYKIIVDNNVLKSGGEFRRLLTQGAVKLDDVKIADANMLLHPGTYVLKVGKKIFLKVEIS